jgi:hypothetical protein
MLPIAAMARALSRKPQAKAGRHLRDANGWVHPAVGGQYLRVEYPLTRSDPAAATSLEIIRQPGPGHHTATGSSNAYWRCQRISTCMDTGPYYRLLARSARWPKRIPQSIRGHLRSGRAPGPDFDPVPRPCTQAG